MAVNSGHIHINEKTHKSFKFLVLLGTSASIKLRLVSCLIAYFPVSESSSSNRSVHSLSDVRMEHFVFEGLFGNTFPSLRVSVSASYFCKLHFPL